MYAYDLRNIYDRKGDRQKVEHIRMMYLLLCNDCKISSSSVSLFQTSAEQPFFMAYSLIP